MPHPLPPEPEETAPAPMPNYEAALKQAEWANQRANTELGVAGSPVMDHRPSVSQQLAMRKAHLEHELKLVNEAIEHALANTPTMALLDSISKVGLR